MSQKMQGWVRGTVLSALLCAVAACSGSGNEQADETKAAAAPAEQPAVSSEVSAMNTDELRAAAAKAVSEQRLYAPAGDNAMEYYLALRDKAPGDVAVSSALADLQPYTLIATEQAITRDDFPEARRLYGLLEKTDPNAPALPRLKASIADAENLTAKRQQSQQSTQLDEARRQEQEKKRQEEQQRMQQQAAQQLAAQRAEERRLEELRAAEEQQRQQAAAREAEERRQAEQRAAAQRQAAAQAAAAQQQQQQQTAPAPAPAPVRRNTELRAISAPQPRYPVEALRSGQSGTVQVEFTVGTNGAVTSARVVNANPPRVFNNDVLNTVRRWRFQPIDEPVTTRRTFTFSPEQ